MAEQSEDRFNRQNKSGQGDAGRVLSQEMGEDRTLTEGQLHACGQGEVAWTAEQCCSDNRAVIRSLVIQRIYLRHVEEFDGSLNYILKKIFFLGHN